MNFIKSFISSIPFLGEIVAESDNVSAVFPSGSFDDYLKTYGSSAQNTQEAENTKDLLDATPVSKAIADHNAQGDTSISLQNGGNVAMRMPGFVGFSIIDKPNAEAKIDGQAEGQSARGQQNEVPKIDISAGQSTAAVGGDKTRQKKHHRHHNRGNNTKVVKTAAEEASDTVMLQAFRDAGFAG